MSGGGSMEVASDRPETTKLRRSVKEIIGNMLLEFIEAGINRKEQNSKVKSIPSPLRNRTGLEIDAINCYGLLCNEATKEQDLMRSANTEWVTDNVSLVKISTYSNKNMFSSFPAAAVYINPYKEVEKAFLEVITQIEDVYICKPIDNLRYLELLNKAAK